MHEIIKQNFKFKVHVIMLNKKRDAKNLRLFSIMFVTVLTDG